MSGKASRDKGGRGNTAAKNLLRDLDHTVDDLTCGAKCGDLVSRDRDGTEWGWEVKNTVEIHPPKFSKQAREDARKAGKKRRWGVLSHIEGTRSWLVLRQGMKPTVWHEKG